jgi:dihydrofolate reductase
MAKLIYSGIQSLDGYVNDASGGFDWSVPTEEVHAAVNEIERLVGTYLYGRRMYEVMSAWEDLEVDDSPAATDYAKIWRAADKVVFSTTLDAVTTSRTRLERRFDPVAILELKDSSEKDLSIGGATIASHALRAGLVDELHLFLTPIIVGGGTRFLPDGVLDPLALINEHRFDNGVMQLHYRVRRGFDTREP